jgi:transposase InsO family protein
MTITTNPDPQVASATSVALSRTAADASPPAMREGFLSPQQRLLILDTWLRSGLPAGDYAPLVGVSKHSLYAWKARFEKDGAAGLENRPRGAPKGNRVPEVVRRAIVLTKVQHEDWGCQRIADTLFRQAGMSACAETVARVLKDEGIPLCPAPEPDDRHRDKPRRFERAKPNQLWQTDMFTFMLKRQNRRVHMVAFMDDHSRFLVSFGLYGSASTALVLEALRAGIASYGQPDEVLTDNGPQYVTWRGTSQFTHECRRLGIKQIVSRPRHPQTLGKIERFWQTLWKELVMDVVFVDLEDARRRIGHFIDAYNFQRPHQGLGGAAVPADRFFHAAPEVRKALEERVAANAATLARGGIPKAPFYLAGSVGGQAFSVHAEGERVVLTPTGGERREVDLASPQAGALAVTAPAEVPATPEPLSSGALPDTALPVCPQGRPPAVLPDGTEAEVDAPGVSPLDSCLEELGDLDVVVLTDDDEQEPPAWAFERVDGENDSIDVAQTEGAVPPVAMPAAIAGVVSP